MNATEALPQPLLVVRRGQEDRYRVLQETFAREQISVIWDRRVAERRRAATTVGAEQRRGDRRGRPVATWDSLGFALVRRSLVTTLD